MGSETETGVRRLLVSAIRGEEEQPSRFLAELAGASTEESAAADPIAAPERALLLADLVGELRRAVCDDAVPADRRRRAAHQLARLAAAGVPGADPGGWYGLPDLSSKNPLHTKGKTIAVSPSIVELLVRCPLRWMVERHGGADPAELAAITGMLVHALAQSAASGLTETELRAELDRAWDSVDAGAPWFSRRERARVHAMLDTFLTWLRTSRSELTEVAVEHDVTVDLPHPPQAPKVRLRGRVDRLESTSDGHPVVVDIKSGKVPISESDAKEHPQLAMYQLAAAYGAFRQLGLEAHPGGARLLYIAKRHRTTGAAERTQEPLDSDSAQHWLGIVHQAAAATTGPEYLAKENSDCPRCPVRTTCPLHSSGRQVP